jgi:hypothetical protein
MSKRGEELRRRFEGASQEEKERMLMIMSAFLAGMLAEGRGEDAPAVDAPKVARRRLRRRVSAELEEDKDVTLDSDVWGGLFDDEGQ